MSQVAIHLLPATNSNVDTNDFGAQYLSKEATVYICFAADWTDSPPKAERPAYARQRLRLSVLFPLRKSHL